MTAYDEVRIAPGDAPVTVKMLRLPAPQKFNTFNTFAGNTSILKIKLMLLYRQVLRPIRSHRTFSTPHLPLPEHSAGYPRSGR